MSDRLCFAPSFKGQVAGGRCFRDPFSGTFFSDSAAPDSIAGATTGSFTSTGGSFGMAVPIGAHSFSTFGILHTNVTEHRTAKWTTQQFREFVAFDHRYRFVVHDRDGSVSATLDETLCGFGCPPRRRQRLIDEQLGEAKLPGGRETRSARAMLRQIWPCAPYVPA